MDAEQKRYAAFISYGHAHDRAIARALERDLRRFARPWNRSWAIRIYRDESNLAVAPDLWEEVRSALLDSRYLILIASPAAAASKWVAREVEEFLAHNGPERLLLVVTGGEIEWDATRGDFDWSRSTALPACLEGRLPGEPKFLDLRWAAGRAPEDLSGGRWSDAVAGLSSVLHDRPKDELYGEDARQHRRQKMIVGSAVAALVVLPPVTVAVTSHLSSSARDEADRRVQSEVGRADTRTMNLVRAETAMDSGDYAGAMELFQQLVGFRRDESTRAVAERFDSLLAAALRDEPAFDPPQWRVDFSGPGRQRVGTWVAGEIGTRFEERIRNPIAYLESVHDEFLSGRDGRMPSDSAHFAYMQGLVDAGEPETISFGFVMRRWGSCELVELDEAGFTFFEGELATATGAVQNGRVVLEVEPRVQGGPQPPRYTLGRVAPGILYAGWSSQSTLSPGVAFRGPDGALVVLTLATYASDPDNDLESYLTDQLESRSRYSARICRR